MEARDLVEDLMAYVPLPPAGQRWERPDATFSWRPGPVPYFGNVSAVRTTAEELPALLDEARRWFAERGRDDFVWFLGPSAAPQRLVDELVLLGAEPFGGGTAMLLESPVPQLDGNEGVDVRLVTSRDELLSFRLLLAEAGGAEDTDAVRAQVTAGIDAAWEEHQAQAGRLLTYLAYVDGEPAAAGGLLLTEHGFGVLAGGGTAVQARGRGLYRALVHARWVAAREAGLSALAVQASEQSSPILRRIGFEPVAELALLRQPV